MKIAVIDDEIDIKILEELVPYYSKHIPVITCGSVRYGKSSNKLIPSVNHGTLCTALLVEALYKRNLSDQVEIINLSIENEVGKNNLSILTNALRYCIAGSFDIVSMSLGVYHLLYAKQMLPLLHQLQNRTVIVAAAANDFKLAYPAAFPCVIGVKRSSQTETKLIRVLHNPVDGIEVIAAYAETPVLSSITKKYDLNYEASNSILVPQICAEMAFRVAQSEIRLSKDQLLAILGGPLITEEDLKITAEHLLVEDCEESIPSLLFQYGTVNRDYIYTLGKKLQLEFEIQGYSCAVLHELSPCKTCVGLRPA